MGVKVSMRDWVRFWVGGSERVMVRVRLGVRVRVRVRFGCGTDSGDGQVGYRSW